MSHVKAMMIAQPVTAKNQTVNVPSIHAALIAFVIMMATMIQTGLGMVTMPEHLWVETSATATANLAARRATKI